MSKTDYLHFLYLARGSRSETQCFAYRSRRLGYRSAPETGNLLRHLKQTFACLPGLIQAVEKESGTLAKFAATLTSLLVLGLSSVVRSPWSVVQQRSCAESFAGKPGETTKGGSVPGENAEVLNTKWAQRSIVGED